MKEILVVIIVLTAIALTIFLIHRKTKKKKTPAERRIPHRVDIQHPAISSVNHSSSPRTPTMVNDSEYLSFRNCPDCHSENTVANQYIYKLGPHEFVCHRCGCRFKF